MNRATFTINFDASFWAHEDQTKPVEHDDLIRITEYVERELIKRFPNASIKIGNDKFESNDEIITQAFALNRHAWAKEACPWLYQSPPSNDDGTLSMEDFR